MVPFKSRQNKTSDAKYHPCYKTFDQNALFTEVNNISLSTLHGWIAAFSLQGPCLLLFNIPQPPSDKQCNERGPSSFRIGILFKAAGTVSVTTRVHLGISLKKKRFHDSFIWLSG